MMRRGLIACCLGAVFTVSAYSASLTNRVFDPYFLGFETDPAMDYGGADITTLHSLFSRGMSKATRISYVAPAYEFMAAIGLSTVQHEVFGHGGRGREFGLQPEYEFTLDFGGSTSLGRDPETMEQLLMVSAGGTESDTLLSRRILQDLYTGDGADGSKVPLMLIAKMDFTLYCLITPDPLDGSDDFEDAYTNGNDIAYYLVSRQGQRRGADAGTLWNQKYAIDYTDPLLQENYDDMMAAALWNLADPAALAAFFGYALDHVHRGRSQVRPPVIPLGGSWGLTAGTRAFLGPDEVTRFLDLYLVTPGPLVSVYFRDLDSSTDRTFGFGAGFHRLPLGEHLELSLSGDGWQTPDAVNPVYQGSGWNVCGELACMFNDYWGLKFKLGGKSEGFFPGTPMADGAYGGAGLLVAF